MSEEEDRPVYLSTARSTDTAGGVVRRGRIGQVVSGNVFALGVVSMLTDVSAEMVTAVLPLYVVVGLGLSPLAFGVLDGIYGGISALVRLAGGHVADRTRRHKVVAGVGYGLSAVAKPALLLATTVPAIAAVLALDRTGKGLRTAPRDALISLSSPPDGQGRAFGVHRALDTAGALMGPLLAFGVLWVAADAYDAVFVVSSCVAALGVLVLVLFVSQPAGKPATRKVSFQGLLRIGALRRIGVCASLLGLVTISDAFVYLLIQKRLDLAPQWFPLLPLGSAAAFLALAVPLGVLADRIGRWPVFLAGHGSLIGAYLLLLTSSPGLFSIGCVLALHGAFYAATDGVLMAAAAPLLPDSLRASGLALIQTGQALGRFGGSLAFGAAWTFWGLQTAVVTSACALALTAVTALLLRPV